MSPAWAAAGAVALAATALVFGTDPAAWAQALPTGGSVASGNAAIVQSNPNTLNINQSSDKAIINWQGFSVGQGNTVNFNQPGASSATLNRVLGSTPSTIAGSINAPGTVLLVNPNGIAITRSGVVNTGSFAASTLDMKDSDFLAGKYKFTGQGASAGVINNGRISVSDGGFAALLGGQVSNNGVISARLGKVGLGAGELITLDLAGDGFLSVAVPSSEVGKLVDSNGALVSNNGKIRADGGQVFLSAATATNLLRNAVNIPGSIRANTVGSHNGRIVINGGTGGKVAVTGRLAAKGKRDGEKGGKIDITGANVALLGATIDASGAAGGGLIRIGGTFQGGGADPKSALYRNYLGRFGALSDIASAQTVTVDAATRIDISAKKTGNAGTAVVWSNDTTSFAGTVTGIAAGRGTGGFVEISGKQHLAVSGAFDLRSAGGKFGTLLFDPGSINIVHGGNTYAGPDTLNDGYLNGLLAVADLVVDTNYATGANGASGDITLKSGAVLSWGAPTTLTLNAARNIVFESGSSISTSAGSVVLAAGNNASGVGTVIFQGSGAQVSETGGGNVTAYYNPASFGTANFNSAGVSGNLTAYMLVNNGGQMTAINGNLAGNYALATDLNFGTFGGFCVNCYFQPLGDFSGKFEGRNHSINFTVYSNQSSGQGLFQSIAANGVVRNLNLTALISSGYYLGGVAGINNGLIDNVSANVNSTRVFDFNNTYATGSTSGLGTTFIGGLVGINNGTISNSTASLTASSIGGFAGGLVGQNNGSISGSSSTGGLVRPDGAKANNNPTYVFNAGGLVGWNAGSGVITTSWSSARVFDQGLASLKTYDGGLVGYNEGTISNSYATGLVQGGTYVGGFVGVNIGSISTSFSTGAASSNPGSGFAGDVGGFAGWNGIVLMGNLIGALPAASINSSWTASSVSGTSTPLLRGFSAIDGGTNANNYFDATATGQSTASTNQFGQNCACGATAVTSANAYLSSSYSAGFMGSAWYMVNGYTRPIQTAFRTGTIGTSNALMSAMQFELVGSNLSGNYKLLSDIDLGIVQSSTIWSSTAGFGPIGSLNGGFTGTFDGQGRVIRNLFINQPASGPLWTGLFGNIGAGGTVQNVGLEGGSVTGFQVVGALAGSNSGSIYNSYSTLNVAALNNVGGLVGVNNGTIARSYATGNVDGTTGNGSQSTGGLVGVNFGTITDAYATGNVAGGTQSASLLAGGIAGLNNGTISNVYYTGTVTGNAGKIGAIAGDNTSQLEQNTGDPDYITYYVTVNHVINNAYWNSDLMASATGAGVGTLNGGGGLSFAQMTNQTNFAATFAGFDFNNTWAPPNQSGQGSDATAHMPGLYAASNIIWLEANNLTRTYGDNGATPSYTVHGLRSGDPQWLVSGVSLISPVTATSNVGTYDLSFGSPQATGRNGKAYRFTTSGTETVTQRLLNGVVTINGIDKVYDGNTNATGGAGALSAANNIVNGDVVTLSATGGNYQTADVSGGLQTVTLNGVALSNGNYALGSLTYSGRGTISPKTLTTSLTGAVTKVYDGTTTATLTGGNYTALQGVVAADVGSVSLAPVLNGAYADANAGSTKQVSVAGLALTGAKAGNYTIATGLSANIGSISKRSLNGSAVITGIDKTYDGTTAANGGTAALTGGFNNVVAGDTVNVAALSGAYTTANVTPGTQTVTVNTISIDNPNYSIGSLSFSGTGRISPATLVVTAATGSKTYDGNTSSNGAPTVTAGTLFGTDAGNFTQAYLSQHVLGAGASTLRASGSVNDGNGGQNYAISFVDAAGTITPATLTIRAVTDGKVYDGNTSSSGVPVAASGLIGADSIGGFTQSFQSRNVMGANGSTLAVNAGSGSVNDGNGGNNYTVVYQTATGTITPAALTITAVTDTKVYDGTRSSSGVPVAALGLVGGDSIGGFTQAFLSRNVAGSGNSLLAVNAGSGTVNDGNGGNNYTLIYGTANGTITPATLTITAVTDSKVYDGTTSSGGVPVAASGLVGGDGISGFTQAFQSRNVLGANGSTLAVNAGSGAVNDGNGGGNYTVVYQTALGTITPAPVVVTANGGTSVYGSSPSNPGLSASGLQNGEDVSVLSGLSNSFDIGPTKSVAGGPYTLSVLGTLSNANYTVTTRNTGTWTVTPASVVVTANSGTSVYGSSPSNPGISATGLQNGEAVSVLTGLSNSFGIGPTMGVAGSPYTLSVLGTLANANYTVTASHTGTWTVTPAPLVVTANGGTSVYGASPSNPGLSAIGLQNGEDVSVLTGLSNSFGIGPTKGVAGGPYTLDVLGTLSNPNYAVTVRNSGSWTVTPAALTITAAHASKIYGQTASFTGTEFTSAGLQNGETVGTINLSSAGQAATAGVAGGPYAIVASNASGGTFNAGNYVITYIGGTMTVVPANVVVTALGGSSVYGQSPVNPGLAATGLQNGESISALIGLFNGFGITNLTGAGNHSLAVSGTLTNPNYKVASALNGNWIVTPATLTYVANPASRYFGEPNPVFDGTVTGFVNGETLATATNGTLQFTSPATPSSLVGQYAINGGGLNAANYVFVQAGGNATALSVKTQPSNPGSQFTPTTNGGETPAPVDVSVPGSDGGAAPVRISFTPVVVASNGPNTDVAPAALPAGASLTSNQGFNFLPISQFDADQYSQLALPDYGARAGAATIFTVIARAIAPDRAADFMIDKFWNGTAGDWAGAAGANPVAARVTFSDGDGHDAAPVDANAFPIVAGKTDFAALLKKGPVVIAGEGGQGSGDWKLAIGLTPDGKGLICADPVTGKLVTLGYDPDSKTLGGITGIYDPKTKGFVAVASAGADVPAGAGLPAALQQFKPAAYFSVTIR